ncbi:BACON domain-containing protein [Streptomyces sp. NPDC001781]
MTSSTPETTTRTTGAHRAQRAHREARDRSAARNIAQRASSRHEAYLDGLFTYCLSVLCDHEAATAALSEVLVIAERRGRRDPHIPGDHRAWLYALARWACLRGLAQARRTRQAPHAAARPGHGAPAAEPAPPAEVLELRRRELALLAWPEAAGTTPEQREALELAVRHKLAAPEVAAVLGLEPAAARELLASAACEVERTRAALAVVETGGCPSVAHLTGDSQLMLSAALRRELVRHVDDCPRCRRTAERAVPGRWPGAAVTPAELPLLPAPRAALRSALAQPPRARSAAVPRFDRRGFPMDPKDRAARRDKLRSRAVTTTVVATVVAAPVLALWAAYRGAPALGGDDSPGAAREAAGPGVLGGDPAGGYQNAGNASVKPGSRPAGKGEPDVSVEVVSVNGTGDRSAGRLAVAAAHHGDTTLITLSASGDAPVRWSATTSAPWLYLSRSAGTLDPGDSVTVKVHVDHLREPAGRWRARVAVAPAGAVVTIAGRGPAPVPPRPRPGTPRPGPTTPTAPPSATPPSQSPPPSSASPSPDPVPSDPFPSDPPESSPPPGDDEDTPSPVDG